MYLLHFERSECDSDGLVYRVGLAERQVPHEEPVTRVVAAGHDVTAVARNPGKLTRQVRTVIAGLAAEPATQAAAAGPGAHSRPGRQSDPGRGEPGTGSRRRQADVGGVLVRPDLDGTQNVQIRSSSRVDARRSSIDQIGGSARVLPDCACHLASQRGWHHLGQASPQYRSAWSARGHG